MPTSPDRRLCPTALLAALLLCARPAGADVRAFSAGSLIIPMDACHQPAGDTVKPAGCPFTPEGSDGPLKAYGLIYVLLQRGVTVYVITDPDKPDVAAV